MSNDLNRLRTEYARRAKRPELRKRDSLFDMSYLFTIQQRQRSTLDLLRKHGLRTLAGKRILEVGCGDGGVLLEYLGYNAEPHLLMGVELLDERARNTHRLLHHIPLVCADGQHLPYSSNRFDLLIQHTMFSSILDMQIKSNIAREMLRVMNKPSGLIIWYDFWTNPTNSQTCGIKLSEISSLFPDCKLDFLRITLAPPVARRIVRYSWILGVSLEKLKLLNTHYLGIIQRIG